MAVAAVVAAAVWLWPWTMRAPARVTNGAPAAAPVGGPVLSAEASAGDLLREAAPPLPTAVVDEVRIGRGAPPAPFARVYGTVTDSGGEGVARAVVLLVRQGQSASPASQHRATTDARGAFAVAEPVAPGEWFLMVYGTGGLRAPRKTVVPEAGEHELRIEVERPDPAQAITGRVVDSAGVPLGDIEVRAEGEGSLSRALSREDGMFTLQRGPPSMDRGGRGVLVTAIAPAREQVMPVPVVAWGQRDVAVVLRPLASVVVRAFDARGAVVGDFDVLCGRIRPASDVLAHDGPGPVVQAADGSVLQTGLPTGEHVLIVRPRDSSLAPGGPLEFAVAGEATPRELRVTVPDRTAVVVHVVDEKGRGIANCQVALLLPVARAPVEPALPAPELAGLAVPGLPYLRQVALTATTTDADGMARVAIGSGTCWLSVRSTTHLPSLTEVIVAPGGANLRVVVTAATVLHGRLVPPVALQELAADGRAAGKPLVVVARRLVEESGRSRAAIARGELARAEVAEDGSFTLGPLPADGVRLQLEAWLRCRDGDETRTEAWLGELDTVAGGDLEREFSVAAAVPASASGVVLLDGQIVANGQFFLCREPPEPSLNIHVPTDAEGHFATRLPPGLYRPRLAIPMQPGPGHAILPLREVTAITAGEKVVLRVDGRARRLRLRVLDANGAPIADRRIRTEDRDGYQHLGALRTDGNGVVDLSPAPNTPFFLLAPHEDGSELRIGPLELPPGFGPAELTWRVGG